jgi:hypothetical protein
MGYIAEVTDRLRLLGESDQPTAAHAGGIMGELDAAFVLGQRGFGIVIGPGGPGGRRLTASGFDIVAFNPATSKVSIVDNKASGGTRTVQEAPALTVNLPKNLEDAIRQIRKAQPFPHQATVIQRLESALAAVRAGRPLPPWISRHITNAGGHHSGISRRLRNNGVRFLDLTGVAARRARAAHIRRARAQGVRPGRPVKSVTPAGGVIGVHPRSKLHARDIVARLRTDPRIPEHLRKGFTAVEDGEKGGIRIAPPKEIKVPGKGRVLPRWYLAVQKAASSGNWQITTGELIPLQAHSGSLKPDVPPGTVGLSREGSFEPWQTGGIARIGEIPGGIAIEPFDPIKKGLALAPGEKRGLLVFANRIDANQAAARPALAQVIEAPALTIVHEMVHAGLLESGIPFEKHHGGKTAEWDEAMLELERMK